MTFWLTTIPAAGSTSKAVRVMGPFPTRPVAVHARLYMERANAVRYEIEEAD